MNLPMMQSPLQVQQPQPAPVSELIDVAHLLRVILHYKWGILGLAFAVTLLTTLLVFSMQPIYRASATIVLESQEANVVNVEQVYSLDARNNYAYTQTQFEVLQSRYLAERVVRKLQLHKNPSFAPSTEKVEKPWYSVDLKALLPASKKKPPVQLSEEEKEEQVILALTNMVAGGLTVTPVKFSYAVHLSYQSTDRVMSAKILNTVTQEFISGNLENRMSGTLQATQWLSERLEALRENLQTSEQALQDFRDREGLVDIEGVTGLGGNELRALSVRLQEASKARIEAQNIMEDVSGLRSATTEELMTLPAVMRHQVIRDLVRERALAERKVAELAKRYGPKHPKMIATTSDFNTAEADLGKEVRTVVSGISREYDIALRNEQQLQANWEARKTEIQDFNRVEFRLQELQQEVETNRKLYDIFFNRIKGVSETSGFEKPHARVIDKALVPGSPVKPNKRLAVSIAFVLSLLLGCGIALLLDMLDNTVKTPDDVANKLGAALLGVLPKVKADTQNDFPLFWEAPHSQYAEAVRTVRTGVVLSSLDAPSKIIVVTSTQPGEGKSTIALNLGAALAQMESTLVIGGDLRRPSLAKRCGLRANHKGLSHFVSGTVELNDCIEVLEGSGMHVMPAGIIPPNPLEMISSTKFSQALETLKGRFDRIIIDSAPLQAVSDALVLSSYADSVIFVVKADSTPATQAKKCIASILGSNEPLTGIVLNQFDVRKASRYYGSDYYQYGDHYQSDEPDKVA